MKKLFTLAAAFMMVMGAHAEEGVTETWSATSSVPDNTVELESITAVFLNNTSKGSVVGSGTWTFSSSYATADANALEVQFSPSCDGVLTITFAAAIAYNKTVNMFINGNENKTMNAAYTDDDHGDIILTSGVNMGEQGYGDDFSLPSGATISYELNGNQTYNFYAGGTKWRLKSFSFTPGPVSTSIDEAKVVAYVTGDADSDYAYMVIDESRLDVTLIEADNAEITLSDLQEYDAVIVSNNVAADAAIVPVLKSAIAYEPMLNLNASLYEAWGLGTVATTSSTGVTLDEAFANDETYQQIADGTEILSDGTLSTITLGDYFADDVVVATIDGAVAMHRHNAGRNTYLNVPMTTESEINFDMFGTFMGDLAVYVAGTKKSVTATTKPTISQSNSDGFTTVTISAATGATIYYTVDGNDPTVESAIYSDELTFAEAATVKAFATLDGYNASDIATADIIIKSQVATPTFVMTYEDNATTVEIECDNDDAEIFFSFLTFSDPTYAQAYDGPITLSEEPTYIYAMATAEGSVNSELAIDYVSIKSLTKETIRMDTVSHFSANQAAWYPETMHADGTGAASAHYYFGKSAWSYYSDEVDYTEQVTDEETGETTTVTYYKADPDALKTMNANEGNGTENDWMLASSGQVICGELTLAPANGVGDNNVSMANRYAETAFDLIGGLATTGSITFKAAASGEPNSAAIQSVKAFKAPFDIVTYIGNGSSGSKNASIQISKDGETWETIAAANISIYQRYIKKTRVSVDDEGSYYVRLYGVSNGPTCYDIYILNNGEVSQAYEAPETSGIESVAASAAEVISTEIYNLNGMRVAAPTKGVNIIRTVYTDGSVKTAKVFTR